MNLYRWVLDNIGILDSDAEFAINPEAFKRGLFFIPFDLSPTGVSILFPFIIFFKKIICILL